MLLICQKCYYFLYSVLSQLPHNKVQIFRTGIFYLRCCDISTFSKQQSSFKASTVMFSIKTQCHTFVSIPISLTDIGGEEYILYIYLVCIQCQYDLSTTLRQARPLSLSAYIVSQMQHKFAQACLALKSISIFSMSFGFKQSLISVMKSFYIIQQIPMTPIFCTSEHCDGFDLFGQVPSHTKESFGYIPESNKYFYI